jgi:hypothetical protein
LFTQVVALAILDTDPRHAKHLIRQADLRRSKQNGKASLDAQEQQRQNQKRKKEKRRRNKKR